MCYTAFPRFFVYLAGQGWEKILYPCPEVINLFSCSTQLNREFLLLFKTEMLKNKTFLAFKLSAAVFSMLINVKMPTIVGILTFMSMIDFILREFSMKKVL